MRSDLMDEHTIAAQQFFPTYKLDNEHKDIAVKEYEAAARALESEERLFGAAAAIAALFVGFFGWLAATNYEEAINKFGAFAGRGPVIFLFLTCVLLFALLAVSYFSEIQQSLVHAARKVVVLRRMLGMSYGKVELVLPANRIEGANEPFSIRMFPGWTSYKCFPIYLIAFLSAIFLLLISARYGDGLVHLAGSHGIPILKNLTFKQSYLPYLLSAVWLVFLLRVYRTKLSDQHENFLLRAAKLCAALFRLRLVGNFEEIIYRARLAVFEAERLKYPLSEFNSIVIHLEDRTFLKHWGVSPRAIAAAAWRYVRRGKRSGGSTITQQLGRSLFISTLRPTWRRKPAELILALWFECFFTKSEILKLYVCCVRYEHGIVGIAEAMHYFFPSFDVKEISKAEVFFLVERIANVRSFLIPHKIALNIQGLKETGLLLRDDIKRILAIYDVQLHEKRLKERSCGDHEVLKSLIDQLIRDN